MTRHRKRASSLPESQERTFISSARLTGESIHRPPGWCAGQEVGFLVTQQIDLADRELRGFEGRRLGKLLLCFLASDRRRFRGTIYLGSLDGPCVRRLAMVRGHPPDVRALPDPLDSHAISHTDFALVGHDSHR